MYVAEEYCSQCVRGKAWVPLESKPSFCRAYNDPAYPRRTSGNRVTPPELGNSALQMARNSRSSLGIAAAASNRQLTSDEKVAFYIRFTETCGTVATAALTGVSDASVHISQLETRHSNTVAIHSWKPVG